ncbi:MAG: hypothetical protein KDD55_01555 [Bdellovibrionales bacterium]|nr:hypothetical protein [Bdellovibrionales bacterium]
MPHFKHIQKAAQIATALLSRPQDIPRYIQTLPLWKSATPLSLSLPWLTYSAIDELSSYLTKEHRVLEWGAGGSTRYFASRVGRVYSKETDSHWYELLQKTISEQTHVTLSYEPLQRDGDGTINPTKYLSIPPEPFSVFLIDGVVYDELGHLQIPQKDKPPLELREACFAVAEANVPEGGLIIVDDAQWYSSLLEANNAKRVKRCIGCCPCNYGIKETTLFYY